MPTSGIEDVEVASCLARMGVTPGESRDRLGRERFHPLRFEAHFSMSDWWLGAYASNPVQNVIELSLSILFIFKLCFKLFKFIFIFNLVLYFIALI
jgi:hypothetical protein